MINRLSNYHQFFDSDLYIKNIFNHVSEELVFEQITIFQMTLLPKWF